MLSLNSLPSITSYYYISLGFKIPHSIAIAMAVSLLSPVIILTATPDLPHYDTLSFTSFLIGSLIPAMAISVKSFSSSSSERLYAISFN